MPSFKDHFSKRAADYARHRPGYPEALFDFLATLPAAHNLAWDCATGNGQAARRLADHFAAVVATDASASQVRQAAAHPRITYRVEPAEQTTLADHSVDLITVATALHWFHGDAFYRAVRRVLKPGGALAVWAYGRQRVGPAVDAVIEAYYRDVVGPWWPPERRHVEAGYATLAFPFNEVTTPDFWMEARWTLPEQLGYLRTWSAAQRYVADQGADPLVPLADDLAAAWGPPAQVRTVRWPIHLRVGRVA